MKPLKTFSFFILIVAFFLSGASALVYQVLWIKHLTLIFGSQTLAISTILASFMSGLSLGSYLMAKHSGKIKKIVLTYAGLEFLIGFYALLIPFLFNLTDHCYRYLWIFTFENYFIISILRFILCFSILIFPTTLMGATLPLLIKYYVLKNDHIMSFTSLLYGINTLGAVIGAFLCGFYFLEYFGMTKTNYIAILLNIVAGGFAILIYNLTTSKSTSGVFEEKKQALFEKTLVRKIIIVSMLISGFSAMIYEVVWARQLVLVFGSSTYSYTSMLVIFLAGISLGSLFLNRVCSSKLNQWYYFALFQFFMGLLVILGTYYYKELFYVFFSLTKSLPPDFFAVNILITSSLLILPPTFVLGILFPLSINLMTSDHKEISEATGLVYAYNTLGCILGSFFAGFIFIPLIGLKYSLLVAAILNLLIAVIFIEYFTKTKTIKITFASISAILIIFLLIFPAPWANQLITSGVFMNKLHKVPRTYKGYYEKFSKSKIVYYKEGQHSTISVVQYGKNKKDANYSLYNNGKIDASTYFKDMRNQALLAYLSLLIVEKPSKVLIIGFGSGITAAVVSQFPVKTIEVVELEKAIIGAAKFFAKFYGDPTKMQKIKIIIDDARNYLRVTKNEYDIIISEPSNIWVSGVASLFTSDYYQIIKQKLKPDGILCQWIQLYDVQPSCIISVLKSLRKEFKYVYICHSKTSDDFLFLASQKPIKLDLNQIDKKILANKRIKKDLLKRFNISNSYDFITLFVANDKSVKKFLDSYRGNVPVNTDNNSFLEFKATKEFYSSGMKYFQEITPLKSFKNFHGINIDDIKNAPADFYKILVLNIIKQQKRSKSLFGNKEGFEKDFYKEQILIYAKKYYQEFKNSSDVLDFIGRVYITHDKIKKGIKYLKQAAKKGSNNPDTYKFLARYYNKLFLPEKSKIDSKKAIQYSKKAVELRPDNAYSRLLLGISYYNDGQYKLALKNINKYREMCKQNNTGMVKEFYEYYSRAYFKVFNN